MAAAEASHFFWAETDKAGQYSAAISDINYKNAWQLSEQVLVECCGEAYDSNGCGGGGVSGPMQCAVDLKALPSLISHPYLASNNNFTCNTNKFEANGLVQSWYEPCATADETCLVNLLGGSSCNTFFTTALKTSIQVISSFYDYVDGVYSDPKCPNTIHNHAVAIVGWGTDASSGMDYWILRNSWGTGWGQGGYFKMQRGNNMCCVACENLFFQ